MGSNRLDFSAGSLVNPTEGLSRAISNASDVIGNISKQYMQQQQLDQQKQQYEENAHRWDLQNQRATELFNTQMDEAKQKKQAYETTQNFAKNYDPQKTALGIVKEQYADKLATDAATRDLANMGPEMSFDQNDKQNLINSYKDAYIKSLDTDPDRKALLYQLAGTVSQPQMEAAARKQAVAAGVPIENVDAAVKSLGQMGPDWSAIDKVGREQKQQNFDNLIKLAEKSGSDYTAALKNSTTTGKPIDPTTLFSTFDGDLTGRVTNSGTNSRKAAVEAYNNIMNMPKFTGPDGKAYDPTYQQKAAIAGVVLNSNRIGDGSKFDMNPSDAVAQAMDLIAKGQVDRLGVVNNKTINDLILNKAREQVLKPYESEQTATVKSILDRLQGTAGAGGVRAVTGNNVPVGLTSPYPNLSSDKQQQLKDFINKLPPTDTTSPMVLPKMGIDMTTPSANPVLVPPSTPVAPTPENRLGGVVPALQRNNNIPFGQLDPNIKFINGVPTYTNRPNLIDNILHNRPLLAMPR